MITAGHKARNVNIYTQAVDKQLGLNCYTANWTANCYSANWRKLCYKTVSKHLNCLMFCGPLVIAVWAKLVLYYLVVEQCKCASFYFFSCKLFIVQTVLEIHYSRHHSLSMIIGKKKKREKRLNHEL